MTSGQQSQRYCVACGRSIDWNANICQYCGHDYRAGAYGPSRIAQPQKSNTGLIIAIVIIIVVLVLVLPAILYVLVLGFGGSSIMTPAATYSKASIVDGEQVNVVSITKTDVPWDDVRVQLSDGTDFVEWDPRTVDLDGGSAVTAPYAAQLLGSLSVTLTVTDVGGNGFVSGSDFFRVTAPGGFSSMTTYTAVLIYTETGERIGTGVNFVG